MIFWAKEDEIQAKNIIDDILKYISIKLIKLSILKFPALNSRYITINFLGVIKDVFIPVNEP